MSSEAKKIGDIWKAHFRFPQNLDLVISLLYHSYLRIC